MDLLDLFVAIKIDDQATSGIESFGRSASNAIGTAGKMAGALVVEKVVEFGEASVETGMQFDAAMSQVAATSGLTMEELAGDVVSTSTAYGDFQGNLREFAQFMGNNTKYSATQAAEALNYMALAGYDVQTSVDMLPSVLNLAAAGNMDLARASDMVTDTQSALGLSLEDTYVLVDQMAATAANSNTSVEQLGDAFLTVGGTAKNLQGGTLEAATALGILANNGIKGAEGGTALRNILMATIPKSDEAAATFERLGISFYDADGEMRPLNDSLADMATAMAGLSTEEKQKALSAIFNKYDLKSATALLASVVGGVDSVTYSLMGVVAQRDDSDAFWESIGMNLADTGHSFEDLDQVIYDSLDDSGRVTDETRQKMLEYGLSAEQADFIMQGLGDTVLGGTSDWEQLAQAIDGSWYTMGSLNQAMQDSGVNFQAVQGNLDTLGISADDLSYALDHSGGNAELFADMLWEAADQGVTLDDIVNAMGGDLGTIQTAFDNTTGAAQQMADVQLDNLQGDITLAQSAAEGLQIAISDHLTPTLRDFVQGGTTLISGLTALVSGDQASADAAFQSLGEQIGSAWGEIQTGIDEMLPNIQTTFEELPGNITTWVGNAGETLAQVGTDLLQGFIDGYTTLVPQVSDFFLTMPSTLVTIIGDVAGTLVDTGLALLGGLYSGAGDAIAEGSEFRTWLVGLPSDIVEAIGSLADTLLSSGSDLLMGMMTGISEISPTLLEFFTTLPGLLGEMMGDLAGALIDKGGEFIGGFLFGNTTNSADLVTFFEGLPQGLLDLMGKVGEFLLDAGKDFIGGFADGIGAEKWTEIQEFFEGLPDKVLGFIGGVGDTLKDKGKDIMTGMLSGIKAVTGIDLSEPDSISNFVKGIPQSIVGFIGDVGTTLLDKGKEIIQGMLDGIGEVFGGEGITGDTVTSFLLGIPGKILDIVAEIDPISILAQAGTDLIEGFKQGIESFDLRSFMVGIFGDWINPVLDALGIASPSKVTHEIGENIMEGAQEGVEEGEGPLDDKLLEISNGIPDNFADAYWSMHEMGAGLSESFGTGMTNAFYGYNGYSGVTSSLSAMAQAVPSYFNVGYNTLSYAGSMVMAGFGNAMVSYFNSVVASQLAAITSAIPRFKGPLDKDRRLLTANGEAIMQSLVDGIENGTQGLYSALGDITQEIPSRISADVSMASTGQQGAPDGHSTTIDARGMFEGATFNFKTREDMDEFGAMLYDWVDTVNRGGFAIAS